MVEIGTTHNVGSSLRVWLVTLPDQHLTRPCLAGWVLAIALGSVFGKVNSSVQVQCVVAFKTYSVELLSSETLVCVLVSSHLWWLINYVSSWGTTRTDTCILLGNGSVQNLQIFPLLSYNRRGYASVQRARICLDTSTIGFIVLGSILMNTLTWVIAQLYFQWYHTGEGIHFLNLEHSSNYS